MVKTGFQQLKSSLKALKNVTFPIHSVISMLPRIVTFFEEEKILYCPINGNSHLLK